MNFLKAPNESSSKPGTEMVDPEPRFKNQEGGTPQPFLGQGSYSLTPRIGFEHEASGKAGSLPGFRRGRLEVSRSPGLEGILVDHKVFVVRNLSGRRKGRKQKRKKKKKTMNVTQCLFNENPIEYIIIKKRKSSKGKQGNRDKVK